MKLTVLLKKSEGTPYTVIVCNEQNIKLCDEDALKQAELKNIPDGCSIKRLKMNFPFIEGMFSDEEKANRAFDKLTVKSI